MLAALLVDETAAYELASALEPAMFLHETNQWIFAAEQALAERGDAVNAITVAHELSRHGHLDEVGGHAALSAIIRRSATGGIGADYYARIVRRQYNLRRLIQTTAVINSAAYAADADVEALLDQLDMNLMDIRAGNGSRQTTRWAKDIMREVLDELDVHMDDPKKIQGMSTGWRSLDFITDGLRRQCLHTMAAETSGGKSLWVHNLMSNLARDGRRVLVCSTEMGDKSIYKRIGYLRGGVDKVVARHKGYTTGNRNDVRQAIIELSEQPVGFCELTKLPQILGEARRQCRHGGLDVFILDHVDDVTAPGSANPVQGIDDIMRGLKELAMEENIAVIAVSQLSRVTEFNKGSRLGRLRGGGGKEQKSDVAMFIEAVQESGLAFRDTKDASARDQAKAHVRQHGWVTMRCSVEKNRDGITDDVLFRLVWSMGGRFVQQDSDTSW